MKFKVGDKVKVRSDLEIDKWYGKFFNRYMDEMKGKTVTIKRVYDDSYIIEEIGCYWTDEMFEDIEDIEVKNKFKKGQTVKIKRTGKIGNIEYICSDDYYHDGSSSRCYCLNDKWYTVHDLEEVQEILDEKEKEYLKAVIKPFKKEFKYIAKIGNSNISYINIQLENDFIELPNFDKDSMYKNMEIDKQYSIEELGL